MKKMLSLLLVLCLMLGLASAVAENADPYGRYEEPITISFLTKDFKTGTTSYDSTNPDRRSATENAWITAYKDYLNVEVKRTVAEDDTALNAQINTAMASGDLPDVIICSKQMFYTLVENGICQDLQAAYDSYLPTSHYFANAVSDELIATGRVDGQLLGFPITNNWYNSTQLLWIRQDWLDKVNMTAPTTIEEMMTVAKAFQDAKLGGDDTIGLGLANDDSQYDFRGILAAYGAVYETWMPQADGSYVYGNVSDQMKDGLLKLQEIYKAGLVKPDFAVSKIIGEEVANGRVGMYYATAWHSVTDIKTCLVNDENANWICVPVPTLDGQRVKQWTNASVAQFCVVTSECEHPEAIFKMMELEQKMYTDPEKEDIPKLYTADDGFLMWDMRIFREFGRTDFDLFRSSLINEHLANGDSSDVVEPVIYDFYTQIEKALAGDRSLVGRYLCQTMAYPLDAELLAGGWLVAPYNGPLTETMNLYQKTIDAELNNAMVKVIMGEDISVFETAVADWYKTGGQTITDEVNAYYAAQ
ncbi:MAG: extracellular solute-binding protein [Eubacteriales bacterium]|nr:extracellular solute-binding protein [Eubacteriales bacterium]